jgi:hypothetical protein
MTVAVKMGVELAAAVAGWALVSRQAIEGGGLPGDESCVQAA